MDKQFYQNVEWYIEKHDDIEFFLKGSGAQFNQAMWRVHIL